MKFNNVKLRKAVNQEESYKKCVDLYKENILDCIKELSLKHPTIMLAVSRPHPECAIPSSTCVDVSKDAAHTLEGELLEIIENNIGYLTGNVIECILFSTLELESNREYYSKYTAVYMLNGEIYVEVE